LPGQLKQPVRISSSPRHILNRLYRFLALVSTIELATNFTATTLLHPSTYLNKILLGSTSGTLQLWNISTQSLIYSFPNEKLSDSSQRDSPITCLVQSPAIDVVGIGFVSGEISVYDVRCDERLMRMWQEGGGVNALAFRAGPLSEFFDFVKEV
jgi:U3 small nucleolar RNA-associated protein 21